MRKCKIAIMQKRSFLILFLAHLRQTKFARCGKCCLHEVRIYRSLLATLVLHRRPENAVGMRGTRFQKQAGWCTMSFNQRSSLRKGKYSGRLTFSVYGDGRGRHWEWPEFFSDGVPGSKMKSKNRRVKA